MAGPRCSFCGKSGDSVAGMVSGGGAQPRGQLPAVHICSGCIELAGEILDAPVSVAEGGVEWTAVLNDGSAYEWACVPQRGGQPNVVIVRRLGSAKSFGYVLGEGEVADVTLVAWIVQRFQEQL
ncbi:MAG: ClpX C4-type zinc finger protein [Myxococcales bacterium]|nr:ClpX C4-type zinc finger protein [Myxococcales bacterium]